MERFALEKEKELARMDVIKNEMIKMCKEQGKL